MQPNKCNQKSFYYWCYALIFPAFNCMLWRINQKVLLALLGGLLPLPIFAGSKRGSKYSPPWRAFQYAELLTDRWRESVRISLHDARSITGWLDPHT
jgi:hypothetical protein